MCNQKQKLVLMLFLGLKIHQPMTKKMCFSHEIFLMVNATNFSLKNEKKKLQLAQLGLGVAKAYVFFHVFFKNLSASILVECIRRCIGQHHPPPIIIFFPSQCPNVMLEHRHPLFFPLLHGSFLMEQCFRPR